MLLDVAPKLEDIVVMTLARHPGCTVEELQQRIGAQFRRYSIPSLYQELRKLRDRAVCMKVGNRYSLRTGWVLDFMSFADEMYARNVSERELAIALPGEGQKQAWEFDNLRTLGQFWTQLILVLCDLAPDRSCFEWAPHAWFSLSHASEESQFLRAMKLARNRYYLIIGHDTKLSRAYATALKDVPGEVSFASSPFEGQREYSSLIGQYLITVPLANDMESHIDRLFRTRTADMRSAVQRGVELFAERGRIKLTVTQKPQVAKRVRRQFSDFYGLRS